MQAQPHPFRHRQVAVNKTFELLKSRTTTAFRPTGQRKTRWPTRPTGVPVLLPLGRPLLLQAFLGCEKDLTSYEFHCVRAHNSAYRAWVHGIRRTLWRRMGAQSPWRLTRRSNRLSLATVSMSSVSSVLFPVKKWAGVEPASYREHYTRIYAVCTSFLKKISE